MARPVHIQPIATNFAGVSDTLARGFDSIGNAFATWNNTLKDIDSRTSARNTGLLQQYIDQHDPNDPNFQQGLQNLRNQFGLIGLPDEQKIAQSISNQRDLLQARAINELNMANTQQQMQHRNELHPYTLQDKQLGLIKAQNDIRDNNLQYENNLDMRYGYGNYGNALNRAFSGELSPEEMQQISETVPGFAPTLIDAYRKGEEARAREQEAFLKSIGSGLGGRGKSGSSKGDSDYNGWNPFAGYTFAGEDPVASAQPNPSQNRFSPRPQGYSGNYGDFSQQAPYTGYSPQKVRGVTKEYAHTGVRNAIAASETAGGNYDSVNLGKRGKYAASNKYPVSEMTVGQVMAQQRRGNFNAAGHYQIIGSTLAQAVKELGIPPDTPFNQETQDYIFSRFLAKNKRPELQKYFDDKGSLNAATRAMAQEWAGLPDITGRSYYASDGVNKSGISLKQSQQSLISDKAKYKHYLAQGMSKDEAMDMALLGYIPYSQNRNTPEALPEALQALNQDVPVALINPQQSVAQNASQEVSQPTRSLREIAQSFLPNTNHPVIQQAAQGLDTLREYANQLRTNNQENQINQGLDALYATVNPLTNPNQQPGGAIEDPINQPVNQSVSQNNPLQQAVDSSVNTILGSNPISALALRLSDTAQSQKSLQDQINAALPAVTAQEVLNSNLEDEIGFALNEEQKKIKQDWEAKRGQEIPQQEQQFQPSNELLAARDRLNQLMQTRPPRNQLEAQAYNQIADQIDDKYVQELSSWQQDQANRVEVGNLANRDVVENYLSAAGFTADNFNRLAPSQKGEVIAEIRKFEREETAAKQDAITKFIGEGIGGRKLEQILNKNEISSGHTKLPGYDEDVARYITGTLRKDLVKPEILEENGLYKFVSDKNIKPVNLLTEEDIQDIYESVFIASETYDNNVIGFEDIVAGGQYDEEQVQVKVKELIQQKLTDKLKSINSSVSSVRRKRQDDLVELFDKYASGQKKTK